MVERRLMQVVRLKVCRLLGFWSLLGAFCACGSNGRPASLVSAGGQSSAAGHSGKGGDSGEAGQTAEIAGSSGAPDESAAGDSGIPSGIPDSPYAVFPEQLEVDVGCGQEPRPVLLVLRNGGALPLTISGLTADSNYLVKVDLPLVVAPGTSGNVLVTPPAPEEETKVGVPTTGTLSFTTNEPGTPTHHIQLMTTLFGGTLEFLDKSGNPLAESSLTLRYSSPDECPDSVTYRVHNSGNLAFDLTGPTFPPHFGGTSTGARGVSLPPDGYAEFRVGGVAASGDVCSGSGQLTFSAGTGLCGTAPVLNVIWPAGSLTGCVCTAPQQ